MAYEIARIGADPPVEEAVIDQTTVEKINNNGVDDDHDGLTDCADPDLAITPSCSEFIPPLDDKP